MPSVATNKRIEIVEAVDARTAEIAEFLKRLIQFDSETGKEGPIQELIASSLITMGLDVDQWVPDLAELAKHPAYIPARDRDFSGRPNVVGIHRGDPAARSLLFNGHVDTIPWTPVSDWQFDPLCGELQDVRILGRVSSDM
jgi:acetylornithine deacetylase